MSSSTHAVIHNFCEYFFQNERYKTIGIELTSRFCADESKHALSVKELSKLPDLKFPKKLSRNAQFSKFIPMHHRYAEYLMKIFNDAKDLEELISLALYVRDQVNPYLFTYAYSVALSNRMDSDRIELPGLMEILPGIFFSRNMMHSFQKESFLAPEKLRVKQ